MKKIRWIAVLTVILGLTAIVLAVAGQQPHALIASILTVSAAILTDRNA